MNMRPGMRIPEIQERRYRMAQEGAHQVADEKHSPPAKFIAARPHIVGDESIDEAAQPTQIQHFVPSHNTFAEFKS